MNLTFKEKSLWLMLFGLLAFSTFYSYSTYQVNQLIQPNSAWLAMVVLPQMVGLFIAATVLLVIISIVGHIVIALLDKRSDEDERDRLIELKGERVGGYVLVHGVFFSLCLSIISSGNFVFTHLLLGFWVLSQMANYATQIIIYRKEA